MYSLILLFIGATLIASSSSEETSSLIIGGQDAAIDEFPYQARIMHFGLPVCSGTIINSRNVLTVQKFIINFVTLTSNEFQAAHCIFIESAAVISFFVGTSQRFGTGGETYRALRVTIHPNYVYVMQPFKMRNDLAIIRSISTIRFGVYVQPAPLATRFVSSNSRGVLSGWGLTGESFLRDRSEMLQKLEMTSISNVRCSLMLREISRNDAITSEKICFIAEGNRSGCNGDSGSPMVINGMVVGVLSWVHCLAVLIPTFSFVCHIIWIGFANKCR